MYMLTKWTAIESVHMLRAFEMMMEMHALFPLNSIVLPTAYGTTIITSRSS